MEMAQCNTHFSPSGVARTQKLTERTSTSFQKYWRPMSRSNPIYDLLQYGKSCFAWGMNIGCQRPSKIRGARSTSQLGCAEMILCMREKRRGGSFQTFTSTLNLTCRFSGYEVSAYSWVEVYDDKYECCCTIIKRETVSANVGIDCSGFLVVRRCSIPSGPYQRRSRMRPWGQCWVRNNAATTYGIPSPLVVRSSAGGDLSVKL